MESENIQMLRKTISYVTIISGGIVILGPVFIIAFGGAGILLGGGGVAGVGLLIAVMLPLIVIPGIVIWLGFLFLRPKRNFVVAIVLLILFSLSFIGVIITVATLDLSSLSGFGALIQFLPLIINAVCVVLLIAYLVILKKRPHLIGGATLPSSQIGDSQDEWWKSSSQGVVGKWVLQEMIVIDEEGKHFVPKEEVLERLGDVYDIFYSFQSNGIAVETIIPRSNAGPELVEYMYKIEGSNIILVQRAGNTLHGEMLDDGIMGLDMSNITGIPNTVWIYTKI